MRLKKKILEEKHLFPIVISLAFFFVKVKCIGIHYHNNSCYTFDDVLKAK
jgi:hypothetical protein